MPTIGEWARRIWYFLNRRRFERELEREMASHRAQLHDSGRFGSSLRLREQSWDVYATARVVMALTQAQLLADERRGMRPAVILLASISLLAIFQAAFGLYAVLAHFVSRRTAEIGIRAVLGATSRDVVRLVAGQSLVPVGIGLGIALGLTPVAVGVMAQAGLTAPIGAGEQIVMLIPVLALLVAAFAAACGPALRATRISPSVAVRAE
jgi:ABC-type antimicrobial peptide transport system permease subunit